MKHVVCFDIGGTNVKYAVMNFEQEMFDKGHFKTNIKCGQDVLDEMCKLIDEFKTRYEVVGITISCPGFVNTKTGEIQSGIIIEGFAHFNIKQYFEEKYNVLVTADNDANCATIAEHKLGNGQGYENVVCITIGTGIGGGIIINNQIYTGSRFMAGEFGFMILEKGSAGVFDSYTFSDLAATHALIKRTSVVLGRDIDGIEIFEEAEKGNKMCQKQIDQFYDYLAQGIYNVCYILNPDKVLLGGAISARPELIEEIKWRLDSYTQSFSFPITTLTEFDRCKFFNDAGLIGSYCNFMNQYEK